MKKQERIENRTYRFAWMNIGLIAVFLFSAIVANGQARVRTNIEDKTKVEIYRSLEDLLNDKVDTTIEADYLVKPKEHGITYHKLLVTRKEGKEVGRVYGFKVGNEVLINPRNPKLRRGKNFFKTERIGDYLNYATVGEVWIPGGEGRPPYRFTFPREELLSIETGKRKLLTRVRLKKILKKDNNLELWKEFKKEKRKSMQLIPYLKQHEASTAQN